MNEPSVQGVARFRGQSSSDEDRDDQTVHTVFTQHNQNRKGESRRREGRKETEEGELGSLASEEGETRFDSQPSRHSKRKEWDVRDDTTHDDWDQGLHDQIGSELSKTGDLRRREGGREVSWGSFLLFALSPSNASKRARETHSDTRFRGSISGSDGCKNSKCEGEVRRGEGRR